MYNENEESLSKQAFEALKALVSLPFLLITTTFNLSKIVAGLTHIVWIAIDKIIRDIKHQKNIIDIIPDYKSTSTFNNDKESVEPIESGVIYEALPQAVTNAATTMYDELYSINLVDKVFVNNGKYIIRFIENTSINTVANYRNSLAAKHTSYIVSYRKGVHQNRMYIQLRSKWTRE